jgi:hypothetical protein
MQGLAWLWLAFWFGLWGALLGPAHALADAASEARTAFERGVEASREQRWDDARREFLRSRELVVKPSTLFNLAVADLKLGLADEAIEALDAFERVASPSEHATMLERAKALRAEAEHGKEAARPATERARGLIEPQDLSPDAQASFAQGHAAYARGDDVLALNALTEAYRLSRRDELLFDVGVVADRLRDDARAIDAFERFVRALPQLPEAEIAQRHLERLRRLKAERGAAEPAATISERSDEPTRPVASGAPPSLATPRALLVVGGVLSAAAIITGLVWLGDRQPRWNDCKERECTNYDEVATQARAAWATTLVLGISGVTLMSVGGALLAKRKREAKLDAVGVSASPHRIALHARVSF